MALSPNDELAEKVAQALGAAGYIGAARLDLLKEKLKSGSISEDDWRLWIEQASEPKANTPSSVGTSGENTCG